MGVGLVGGQGGCERNVGVEGDVGYGGCEPRRIEGIVKCTKRYCAILRKSGGGGGGGRAIFEPKTLSMYLKKKKKKKVRHFFLKKLTEPGLNPRPPG